MNPQLPLAGCMIGVSVSPASGNGKRRTDASDVNYFVTHLTDILLGAGARLAFGHDWRPSGVMKAVAEFAVQYQSQVPVSAQWEQPSEPLVVNFVAPPDRPYLATPETADDSLRPLADEMRQRLRGIVDARQGPAPNVAVDAPTYRPEALTLLREHLNEICDARICLGGPLDKYQGWFPGVIEEAYLALESQKPLWLSPLFGGAAEWVIHALDKSRSAERHQVPRPIGDDLYVFPKSLNFGQFEPIWIGLDTEELQLLHNTDSPQRVAELILRGLCKWWVDARRGRVVE